ncbi:hypothetical protein TPHA_0I00870 [Tetrapisispora phaffii CBS 4417]|uniref:Ribosome-releasing factor 2, mitochondrial n=1 Tax=Tetrapisispora phaffii (strain ATCC 24235 / CBS 4417 / NBRC 1672 / NRRL Y-8282 / UCD 70-5) TaxID=1071381 RepID=G8BXG5_TETPH|nr:hypothetical protein TPHA_0I00870 [Tetrapisispora phaffii CBS 4417]CCE64593.1 hypothetical protein TPHA_0I00870 [Tetrapisispora phaffii CBS 4417]
MKGVFNLSLGRCSLRMLSTGSNGLSRIRNIGIIAHIDAGKTTTTETMLYYSGKINRIGNVDQGDTVTDFLPQERERGITIQSAAITFNWQNNYKINLIDTPGHADFTFEVIKSLKVLDGCVTILDAVAGVEAQTEKVWKQSTGLPKICFINKMDRIGAGFSRTVKEVIVKLKQRVAVINTPLFRTTTINGMKEDIFNGVLDIVNMKKITWDSENPDDIKIEDVTGTINKDLYETLSRSRESLIEKLGEFDENIISYFLEEAEGDYFKVPPSILNESIRKATLAGYVTPVLCGSSFKHIGVQPLLDAIVSYLPSPIEARPPEVNNKSMKLVIDPSNGMVFDNNKNISVALVFKVIRDKIRGMMAFVRVYSGSLKNGHTVLNSSSKKSFKIGKPVLMNANIPEDVQVLHTGEIGVLTGTSIIGNLETGDTLISDSIRKSGINASNKELLDLKINPIIVPPPVFSVVVEPKTLGNKASMEASLQALIMEDPSLHVTRDEESGQTMLSGMGVLHLEIARDKLLNELSADVNIGKLMVSYKETLETPTDIAEYVDDKGYSLSVKVEPVLCDNDHKTQFTVNKIIEKPGEIWYPLGIDNNYLIIEKNNLTEARNLKFWPYLMSYDMILNALSSSSIAALQYGGKLGNFPLFSCAIRVSGDINIPKDVSKPNELLSISRKLILKTLNQLNENSFSVLEPIMKIEVTIPQKAMGNVMQDLTGSRKAIILSIDDETEIIDGKNGSNVEFKELAENEYLPSDITLKNANLNDDSSNLKIIKASAPVKEMMSYSTKLRGLTEGRGSVYSTYHGMEKVPCDHLESILNE